ncbi:MAG: nucleoid-associated protein [Bacteroidia bacterium]
MIQYHNSSLHETAVHFVGNPSNDEPITISESLLTVSDEDQERLLEYFMHSFKPEAFYRFSKEDSDVLKYIGKLFEGGDEFLETSAQIANHLFDVSTHPKILSGDLFVARIREINLHGEFCDGIVFLKAENEDGFAQVEWKDKHSEVVFSQGYRLDRIDKACLILSLEPGEGYQVLIVDKTNGNAGEAQYWSEAFLGLEAMENSYHHTQQFMHITKEFLKEKMPEEFQVSPADQIALLNKSSQYFKDKDTFEIDAFSESVIQDASVADAFKNFTRSYSEDPEHSVTEQFDISKSAVKKHAGMFKSILKLDKNFHIYVHGNRQMIERGYDEEKNMNYYKVFFNNETTS